jgi:hypothetical protein
MMVSMSLDKARYQEFQRLYKAGRFSGQRVGQAFFNHFNLHICTQNKPQLDRLYLLDGEVARQQIELLFEIV